MGNKPDPYEPGEDCTNCWGEGKEWGDYPTPKKVTVTFSGIDNHELLPPFPNGVPFTCEQSVESPCIWIGEFPEMTPDGFTLFVQYGIGAPNNSQLVAFGGVIGTPYFEDTNNVNCAVHFNNEKLLPPLPYGNGTGHVT